MSGITKPRKPGGRHRFWYTGADGRRVWGTGFTDKDATRRLLLKLEEQARLEREGLSDPAERRHRAAASVPVADHVAAWRRYILDLGKTAKHARHQAAAALKLLEAARVAVASDLSVDLVAAARGRMRESGSSPRTCNHALAALKSFYKWLALTKRAKVYPPELSGLKPFPAKVGRVRVRRAATPEELERLYAAAEASPTVLVLYGKTKSKLHGLEMTGPDRAALYRLALGTGFRADELRSLRPEWFELEGADPRIVVPAGVTKNRKGVVQPIARPLAAGLKAFVAASPPGEPLLKVPTRTAQMLRADLEAAGVPYRDGRGRYLDFHALRASYVTHLVRAGVNPKLVQKLARHASITTTMDVYADSSDDELRRAIDSAAGGGKLTSTPDP